MAGKQTADLKTDFEHLEMIYSNSTGCFRNQPVEIPCENCSVLKNQVKYLIKTCAKFTRGEANLEVVLGSQNCVFGKAGLGFNLSFQKKTKKFSSLFSKSMSSDMSFISCNYCMQKGHVIKNCYVRKYNFPKGIMKWIPKGYRKAEQ